MQKDSMDVLLDLLSDLSCYCDELNNEDRNRFYKSFREIYSNEEFAIKEAEKWIKNTKTSDINVKRITDTEWYFWYEENGNTYGGYVDVYGKELDKPIE